MNNVVSINIMQERIWNEFVSAQRRAMETLSFEDGQAARRAWRRWLEIEKLDDRRAIQNREGAQS